jgi:diacylglycerol kinase
MSNVRLQVSPFLLICLPIYKLSLQCLNSAFKAHVDQNTQDKREQSKRHAYMAATLLASTDWGVAA